MVSGCLHPDLVARSATASAPEQTRTSGDFKTKDLRTLLAHDLAAREVAARPAPTTQKEYDKARREVGAVVYASLGNTPAVALGSYIDPAVFGSWQGGFA